MPSSISYRSTVTGSLLWAPQYDCETNLSGSRQWRELGNLEGLHVVILQANKSTRQILGSHISTSSHHRFISIRLGRNICSRSKQYIVIARREGIQNPNMMMMNLMQVGKWEVIPVSYCPRSSWPRDLWVHVDTGLPLSHLTPTLSTTEVSNSQLFRNYL